MRPEWVPPPTSITTQNGKVTSNPDDIHAAFLAAWLPDIFQKFLQNPKPSYEDFRAEYANHIRSHICQVQPITADDLSFQFVKGNVAPEPLLS